MPEHDLFLTHLPVIERAIAFTCRRNGLRDDEAEDFASTVRLKLLEDDGAVLRKFKGEGKMSTYLATVVQHLFQDYRIAKWGKWRPSAAARRAGTTAVRLERLTGRDGIGFDEAVEMLRRNFGVTESTAELAEIAGRLPPRARRRFEGEEALERAAAPPQVEDRLHDRERRERAADVGAALTEALAELPAEERLLLKMRYADGFTVARIAKVLDQPQRRLYGCCDKALRELRRALEARGVTAEEAASLVGWETMELEVDFGLARRESAS